MNRTVASLLLIGSLSVLPDHAVSAQGAAHTRDGFSLTPYLWTSSLSGRVGVGPLGTNVDLSFGDILDHLKFALMATGEYRRDQWVVLVDGVYVSIGDEAVVAFLGDTGRFDLTQRETIIQPMGGYTILGPTWAIDLLGGVRYWKLKTTLDVEGSRRSTTSSRTGTRAWVDGVAGLAVHWLAMDKLHVTGGADAGGGGSLASWQAYGAVDYDVWHHVSLGAAYRALSVDYDHDNVLFDTDLKGFLIRAKIHF